MIQTVVENVKDSMFRPINRSATALLAIFSMLWGFWVGNPFWDTFEQAALFDIMSWLAPEWLWGASAFALGVFMMLSVKRKPVTMQVRATLAGFYFWLFASINFFIGDWQNTGGITLLMIAIYSGYVALNLSINRDYYLEK